MSVEKSLQETYAPRNTCFGCGPANEKGLRIRSFKEGDELVCRWTPQEHHQAAPGMVNGGICGALLDCHSNWTAATHLMWQAGDDVLPSTVTADFHVKLRRVTPLEKELTIRGRVAECTGNRVTVDASIEADGEVTATCRGTFVAIQEGHPAWHRW